MRREHVNKEKMEGKKKEKRKKWRKICCEEENIRKDKREEKMRGKTRK